MAERAEAPLVSVVVPIYAVERYLERCLQSIVDQDYHPLEVILVDDGSNGRCAAIIQEFETQWSFIRSVRHANQGLSLSRNLGISLATGRYLVFIDSDDYVEPGFISGLVSLAERDQSDVVICNYYLESAMGFRIPFPLVAPERTLTGDQAARLSLDLTKSLTCAWDKLYRRNLLVETGFSFPSIRYEDIATAAPLLSRARTVTITRKPYYHYCMRTSSITGRFGPSHVIDYLKAVDAVRQFIWRENRWVPWRRAYRLFLSTAEAHLFLQLFVLKNRIPPKYRWAVMAQIHVWLRGLAEDPQRGRPNLPMLPIDLPMKGYPTS